MKVKACLICMIACSLCAASTQAGFRNVDAEIALRDGKTPPEAKMKTKSGRNDWKATIVRSNGKKERVANLGGYFESVDVEPLETLAVQVTGKGLREGTNVVVFVTHGGKVNGGIHASIPKEKNNELQFAFQAGSFGTQPVYISLDGRSVMMAFSTNRRTAREIREIAARREKE